MNDRICEFEDIIGYTFDNKELLINALTHSSYANENSLSYDKCNERLEYLGDAVLELVTSRFLYELTPSLAEGEMTTLRASLVCEPTLAGVSRQIGLREYIILGKGEQKTGGRDRDSVLSDAFEAVIGAIYIDGGFERADEFIRSFLLTDIESKSLYYDSKSKLQEIVQDIFHENTEIIYELLTESGPAHNKSFLVECTVQGRKIARGEGHTKKKAEQEAAYRTLLFLRKEDIKEFFKCT